MERLAERSNPLPGLAKCALEPIHIIGHIQPHGLLFALSEPDLSVSHVSTNVSTLLGMSPDLLLGCSFETVLGAQLFETFRSQILSDEPFLAKPFYVPGRGRGIKMHATAHRHDGVLIVELELVHGTHSLEPLELNAHIRIPVTSMEQAEDVLKLSRLAAEEIRRLSGFDRVMVYRFDEFWNGEVIAEAVGSLPILYLGSRFPESDIPTQARQLFLMNASRSIADVDATPVPIVPEIGPLTGKPLDLTRSSLRSVSTIHITYLRNMNVQSSMTLSIIVNHRLWGMMACHGAAPHRLDHTTRSVCELIVQIFASQLALRIDNLALQCRLTSRRALEKHMAEIEANESFVEAGHFQFAQLLDLLCADGMISRVDGVVSTHGATVDEELLLPVIAQLQGTSARGVASSNHLSSLDSSAASFADKASGALYIGLTEGTGDYILLLRRELTETVMWAGNPDKTVSVDEWGRLRPRTSFAAWKEIVRGRSQPWSELELENASLVREQLIRLREAHKLHKSEEHVRYMANYDALTGLLNRHALQTKLEQCIQQAGNTNSSLAVLFIDLDHFKPINDRFGHTAGDSILKITAKRIQHQLRPEDFVGRLGGDEFVVILPGLRLETDLLKVVSRILSAVEKPLKVKSDETVAVTASIGASWYPVDGTTAELLIGHSDKAMYRVKAGGGNAFELSRTDSVGDNRDRP
jgi:two-component system, chemotaxis family, sensor kinase Cph1